MGSPIDEDEEYMAMALKLAQKGRPSPNPKVGCVVVKDGYILKTGYHKKAGGPHAEVEALQGINAEGATMYVNLEPCSHYGKTPPCTDMIIKSGVHRVVCAMKDPNPVVKGIEILRKNGIEVTVGVMKETAQTLNEKFIKYMKKGTPFVTVKYAMSLDGKIACNSGDSKWITHDRSREYARHLRGDYDAIMVGINTVLQDDPGLKALKNERDPTRVILDSTLRIPVDSQVLSDTNVIIATTEKCDPEKKRALEKKARIIVCGYDTVDLKKVLTTLGETGVTSVFIEGGSEVNASAVNTGLVDKILVFIAPKLITGRKAKGPIGGSGIETMCNTIQIKKMTVHNRGTDILIEAYL
ncbi:MAG: bifunctional diaminohydroxyphosphoribosylaminopyrimidine deaminase/5-amino-6-(5-phosphoribosylamino)uracil reductase RibD [Candidatus Methanofastidiosia archaeon]|jgi:diaminohydroxyphosphoribosylaminopyrimidine deaminase/5-amino-6-(5-phosphoribosylamino)uracil reductase